MVIEEADNHEVVSSNLRTVYSMVNSSHSFVVMSFEKTKNKMKYRLRYRQRTLTIG